MRSVVIALVIAALLAIWLTTQFSHDMEQGLGPTGRDVGTVMRPVQESSSISGQEELQGTAPNEPITSADASIDVSSTTTRKPEFRMNPETRGEIVDYLSESGLSAVDSERIADSALVELKECVERTVGVDDASIRDSVRRTCTLNVFANYGLARSP